MGDYNDRHNVLLCYAGCGCSDIMPNIYAYDIKCEAGWSTTNISPLPTYYLVIFCLVFGTLIPTKVCFTLVQYKVTGVVDPPTQGVTYVH